jgi:hypothetical protein
MNKEFIPYELALELKELGFDEPCFRFYSEKYTIDSKTGGDIKTGEFYLTDRPKTKPMRCSAPLYQQAFRWLYQKLGIEKGVMPLDAESQQLLLKELINKLSSKHLLV